MATFKFYKVKGDWYFKKRPGFEDGRKVDLQIIEEVFGVVGSRHVEVTLPEPGITENYRVTINNGFMIDVHLAIKGENGYDLEPVNEFVTREMKQ